jgi:hypothetical protein
VCAALPTRKRHRGVIQAVGMSSIAEMEMDVRREEILKQIQQQDAT